MRLMREIVVPLLVGLLVAWLQSAVPGASLMQHVPGAPEQVPGIFQDLPLKRKGAAPDEGGHERRGRHLGIES